MYEDITRISPEDIRARPPIVSPEDATRAAAVTGVLGLASLIVPAFVFLLCMLIAGNKHIAGAMCFFCYAQIAHAVAARRTLARRNALVELFYIDQRRRAPRIPANEVDDALSAFTGWHRQLAYLELFGSPLAAILLAITEAAVVFTHPGNPVIASLFWVAPALLILVIGLFVLLHRRFEQMQTATFQTPDRLGS